jgi:hypothetical protein
MNAGTNGSGTTSQSYPLQRRQSAGGSRQEAAAAAAAAAADAVDSSTGGGCWQRNGGRPFRYSSPSPDRRAYSAACCSSFWPTGGLGSVDSSRWLPFLALNAATPERKGARIGQLSPSNDNASSSPTPLSPSTLRCSFSAPFEKTARASADLIRHCVTGESPHRPGPHPPTATWRGQPSQALPYAIATNLPVVICEEEWQPCDARADPWPNSSRALLLVLRPASACAPPGLDRNAPGDHALFSTRTPDSTRTLEARCSTIDSAPLRLWQVRLCYLNDSGRRVTRTAAIAGISCPHLTGNSSQCDLRKAASETSWLQDWLEAAHGSTASARRVQQLRALSIIVVCCPI